MSYDNQSGFGGSYGRGTGDAGGGNLAVPHGSFEDATADGMSAGGKGKRLSTTQWLAKTHGVKNAKTMYVRLRIIVYGEKGSLETPAKVAVTVL